MPQKSSKAFSCAKGESQLNHSTVTRWVKKFHLRCKKFDDPINWGWSKPVDSEAVLQTMKIIPACNTQRVSDEFGIVTFIISVTKVFGASELCLTLIRYCQTYDTLKGLNKDDRVSYCAYQLHHSSSSNADSKGSNDFLSPSIPIRYHSRWVI